MVGMGLIRPEWRLSPRDAASPAWADAPEKEWEARCMEVYAAMIDCMDQGVGRILAALKETGRYENTLIFFLADNGGSAEGMGRRGQATARPLQPVQPMSPGELQGRMVPQFSRDGYPVRQGRGVLPGPDDTYIAYGRSWANVSNTPFREYKHWVHEGGIASPLIVHWPAGLAADRRSRFEPQPAHLIDLMATCVDLAGADYPREVAGRAIPPLEGVSLRPAFSGRSLDRREPLFWEHEGNRAIRSGRWKLVARGPLGAWELYDLEVDRSELRDLASEQPQRVQDLAQQWEAWARRTHTLPWPWDAPNGKQAPAPRRKRGAGP
jgi:arylsulfatase